TDREQSWFCCVAFLFTSWFFPPVLIAASAIMSFTCVLFPVYLNPASFPMSLPDCLCCPCSLPIVPTHPLTIEPEGQTIPQACQVARKTDHVIL
uniref:Uncharacterized protein n=1 Tax=Seriola dumerili TaxID=41447 RepID=A0A3B4TPJ4_SERDU